jgi:hypothetical protein
VAERENFNQGNPFTTNRKKFMLNDTERINISRYHEVQYWTKKLDLTAAQLADIIDSVGDTVDAVRTRAGR